MTQTTTQERVSIADRLDRRAHWIEPGRITKDDELVHYTGVWFPERPWGGIERELRMLQATGRLLSEQTDYLLDIKAENGDLLDTFSVSRETFAILRNRWKFVRDRESEREYEAWRASREAAHA